MISKEKGISWYNIFLFAVCFLSTAFGGAVSTLMSVYLPEVLKDFSDNKTPDELNDISAYINSVFVYGWAIGGFTWGIISDRRGRKKSLLYSIGLFGISTVLTGLMNHWWGIFICRFFSGFCMGGILVVTLTLVSEVWPTPGKAIIIGILSIAFPVGIFSAGMINYMVASWRHGFFVGFIPLLIAVISVFFLKDSFAWQEHQAKRSEGVRTSLLSKEMRTPLVFGSLIFGLVLIGLWAIFLWLPTWIQSIIMHSDGHKERGLSMMVLGVGGLVGGFLSGWLVNFAGVRKTLLVCLSVCAFFSFLLFKTNPVFSAVIYAEIIILALFFGVSQGVLSVYIPHLFPVEIRASATGFCLNIGRIFTATAVLFIGILVTTLRGYGNTIFVFSLVFVIGLLILLFTKDQPDSFTMEMKELDVKSLKSEIN